MDLERELRVIPPQSFREGAAPRLVCEGEARIFMERPIMLGRCATERAQDFLLIHRKFY